MISERVQGGAQLKRVWIYLLIAVALVAGVAFVACGGEEEEEGAPPAAATEAEAPTEAETEEAVVEEEEEEEEGDGAAEASIADVPVYPGATEVYSGEWSGGEAAIPMAGAPIEAGEYATVEYAMFETGDSVDDVFSFYEDEMGDWEEVWTFSGGDEEGMGGMAIWTKDDGEVAAWVVVAEEDGATSLMIAVGH